MLTADTITADDIRELRSDLIAAGGSDTTYTFVASCALTGQHPYTAVGLDDAEWRECRARCAEIINARRASEAK